MKLFKAIVAVSVFLVLIGLVVADTGSIGGKSSGGSNPVAGTGISVTGSTVSINTAVTVDKTTAQTLTNKTLTSPIVTTQSANDNSTKAASTAYVDGATRVQALVSFTVDGGGNVITSGNKSTVISIKSGTITGWTIQGDVSGTVTVDVYKQAYSSAGIPNTSITGSVQPSVTTAFSNKGTTLTGWTTAISQFDQLTLNVSASGLANFTRINVVIYGTAN